jgi:hypothetical protein
MSRPSLSRLPSNVYSLIQNQKIDVPDRRLPVNNNVHPDLEMKMVDDCCINTNYAAPLGTYEGRMRLYGTEILCCGTSRLQEGGRASRPLSDPSDTKA